MLATKDLVVNRKNIVPTLMEFPISVRLQARGRNRLNISNSMVILHSDNNSEENIVDQ